MVRESFEPQFPLIVDANHAYNVTTAIWMGRVLEAQSVLWFKPVIPEDR